MKILAQGFSTTAQDSNPGSRNRESKALPLSHCALQCSSSIIRSPTLTDAYCLVRCPPTEVISNYMPALAEVMGTSYYRLACDDNVTIIRPPKPIIILAH